MIQLFILIIITPCYIDLLGALLYLYNPMVHGPWVDIYNQHYITKLRADKPMTPLQNTRFVPTKCGVFTSGLQLLTKIWALRPKISLGGSRTQLAPNTNIVTHPRVTLSLRRSLHEDLPTLLGSLQDQQPTERFPTALPGCSVMRPL